MGNYYDKTEEYLLKSELREKRRMEENLENKQINEEYLLKSELREKNNLKKPNPPIIDEFLSSILSW